MPRFPYANAFEFSHRKKALRVIGDVLAEIGRPSRFVQLTVNLAWRRWKLRPEWDETIEAIWTKMLVMVLGTGTKTCCGTDRLSFSEKPCGRFLRGET
jgi:hypothetical protein